MISALVQSERHVPYLESKLTTILRSAFGGNSRTIAIMNCRSDDIHGEETLNTLRFGERCGMISNEIKAIAVSSEHAMTTIDAALSRVSQQLELFESRSQQHLASYKKLRLSYFQLESKRNDLVKSLNLELKKISDHTNIE